MFNKREDELDSTKLCQIVNDIGIFYYVSSIMYTNKSDAEYYNLFRWIERSTKDKYGMENAYNGEILLLKHIQ